MYLGYKYIWCFFTHRDRFFLPSNRLEVLLLANRVSNKYMILLLVLKPIWNDFCLG